MAQNDCNITLSNKTKRRSGFYPVKILSLIPPSFVMSCITKQGANKDRTLIRLEFYLNLQIVDLAHLRIFYF